MKNAYVFLFLLSFLKTAAGQVEKPVSAGHFLVGGSISYYSQTSKQTLYVDSPGQYVLVTTKEDVFQPDVILGYYLFNHFAIGILADANTFAMKQTYANSPDIYKYRSSTFGLGPLIRYSTNFGLFIQGSASFGFNNNYSALKDKWKSLSYSLGGGYSFFFKGLVSIEPSLSYKYTRVPSHGLDGVTKTGGIFFSLGTYIYFNLVKKD